MHRVRFNVNTEYAYLENFKILSSKKHSDFPLEILNVQMAYALIADVFRKHAVERPINVEQLIKCKMQDNLEFLQWTKRFWDQYYPGGDYDALARRKGTGAPPPSAAPASMRTSTTRRPGAASAATPGARTRTPLGGGANNAAMTALQQENAGLKETVAGLERERDFYFSKLRDIELLVQGAFDAEPELEKDEGGLLKQIQTILYSTEEGFEIPAETEEGGAVPEEETF